MRVKVNGCFTLFVLFFVAMGIVSLILSAILFFEVM